MSTDTLANTQDPLTAANARFRKEGAPVTIGDFKVTPLHPCIGARVEGPDLRGPLSQAQRMAIETAMDRFAVCCFPGQKFEDDEQFAFGSQFGKIEDVPTAVDQGRRRLANKQINDISNIGADGKLMPADDRRRMYNLGNLLWHSDSSFKRAPAHYSMLHARVIPPEGGETEFSDMRAAWDALPPKMKAKVKDLVCEHSVIFSRAQLGFEAFSPEEIERCKPVQQRLVRRHESSDRLSLFLSAHIGRVLGMPTPEGMALIRELSEFATQPEFVYQHVWTSGDLVIWDNRCTMHRGRNYESLVHPRDLRRVTVGGKRSTMDETV